MWEGVEAEVEVVEQGRADRDPIQGLHLRECVNVVSS